MRLLLTFFLLTGVISIGSSQEIPFRNDSTYKLELLMEFKVPEPESSNTVDPGHLRKNPTNPELYVNLKLNLLHIIHDDYRIKIVDNRRKLLLTSRLKKPDDYVINIGRARWVKENKVSNYFNVQFLNKEKEVKSKITIEIKENGDFMVNDKLFGKI